VSTEGSYATGGLEILPVQLGEQVIAGFTTRNGGCSTGPAAGANMSYLVGDDAASVEANRAELDRAAGVRVSFATQVHSADMEWIKAPWTEDIEPRCDGLATTKRDLGVAMMGADCAVVLLADERAGIVAALHAGWRGLIGGLVPRAIASLRERGAKTLQAAIGPTICGSCYEIGPDVAGPAAAAGMKLQDLPGGRTGLDIAANLERILIESGVANVTLFRECTYESKRLYSHRRDGTGTGRQCGFIAMRSDA
jgi:YfiH family protein